MTLLQRHGVLLPAVLLALACGGEPGPSGGAGGTGTTSGGSGPGPIGGGGGGSGSSVPLAGSGQALGGGDQGMVFGPGDVVMIMPPEMGGMMNAGGGGGGSGIPGDGKSMTATMRRGMSGTAIFTQTGEDVTVVFALTGCADGNHPVAIHDGYACDSATTEGVPWGARGTGIGPDTGIACSGGNGKLTYTRTAADKTKNWTVADHVQETDVTAHVLIIGTGADPRAVCANFF